MTELASGDIIDDVARSGSKAVMFIFYAVWCGPCARTKAVVDAVSAENADWLSVVLVDIEKHQAAVNSFFIVSIPVFLIFKKGVLLKRFVGVQTKESLLMEIGHV